MSLNEKIAVIRSADVLGAKLTLIRSTDSEGSRTSDTIAAISEESRPPENIIATASFYSLNGMLTVLLYTDSVSRFFIYPFSCWFTIPGLIVVKSSPNLS